MPEVETALREGQLCLTTINELAKVLTPENREEILPRFFGLSRKTAAVLAASLQPAAVIRVRDVVTPVRTAPRAVAAAVEPPAPSAPVAEPVSVPFRPGEVPAAARAISPGRSSGARGRRAGTRLDTGADARVMDR